MNVSSKCNITEWRRVVQPEVGAPTPLTIVCVTTVSTTSGRKVGPASHCQGDVLTDNNLSAQKLLPTDLPLVDDNSDFTLHGYQNFLIEPNVRSEATGLYVVCSL